MRRKGVIVQTSSENVLIQLDSGGFLRLKRSVFPSLQRDMHVVVEVKVAKAKKQPCVSPIETESRRKSRWAVREYFRLRAKGERPSIIDLMRRPHLLLVEDSEE